MGFEDIIFLIKVCKCTELCECKKFLLEMSTCTLVEAVQNTSFTLHTQYNNFGHKWKAKLSLMTLLSSYYNGDILVPHLLKTCIMVEKNSEAEFMFL